MENASKALIIAGAILISILLISVGIMVMNSINEPLNQSEDESKQQAIQMFNSKYTQYAGSSESAQSVKSLMTLVQSNAGADSAHTISVSGLGKSTAGDIQSAVKSSKKYTITIEDKQPTSAPDGYIDTITVSENQ